MLVGGRNDAEAAVIYLGVSVTRRFRQDDSSIFGLKARSHEIAHTTEAGSTLILFPSFSKGLSHSQAAVRRPLLSFISVPELIGTQK